MCVLKTVCSHSTRVAPDSRQISVPTLLLKGGRRWFQTASPSKLKGCAKKKFATRNRNEWASEGLIAILGNGTTVQTTGDCSIGKLRNHSAGGGNTHCVLLILLQVAIKKIGHASATPTLARRTLREIRVLRHIRHEVKVAKVNVASTAILQLS